MFVFYTLHNNSLTAGGLVVNQSSLQAAQSLIFGFMVQKTAYSDHCNRCIINLFCTRYLSLYGSFNIDESTNRVKYLGHRIIENRQNGFQL